MSREEWVARAEARHGKAYDYSEVDPQAQGRQKVTIICSKHGPFQQTWAAHGRGQGCPPCSQEECTLGKTLTPEAYLAKAQALYPHYSYRLESYGGYRKSLEITCPHHGPFTVVAAQHLQGKHCTGCMEEEKKLFKKGQEEAYLAKAKEIHCDAYTYGAFTLRGKVTLLPLTCTHHGPFAITARNHLMKREGCPSCHMLSGGRAQGDLQEAFILKAKQVHGTTYSYEKVVYRGSKTPVEIGCSRHGSFFQRPADHLITGGCEACGHASKGKQLRKGREAFILEAQGKHGTTYDYRKVVYRRNREKVTITCPEHGDFEQTPLAHLKAWIPCPSCQIFTSSQGEKEVLAFIESIYSGPVEARVRGLLSGKQEVDIWLPDLKVGVEYNGLYGHDFSHVGKHHHAHKTKAAQEAGFRLLHIWEDDWRTRRPVVEAHLQAVLGLLPGPKFHARKTKVKVLTAEEARTFLEAHHIQGYTSSTVKLGLVTPEDELVACALFRHDSSRLGSYVLTRYATSRPVRGGHSKLVAHFERTHSYDLLTTFADLTFSEGDLYRRTGWQEAGELYPDYSYVVQGKREHKFSYRLKRFREDPDLEFQEGLTEWKLAELNGLERIYDAGKLRFVRPHPGKN